MWSIKYKKQKCQNCGTSERKHWGFGMCGRCYCRQRYANSSLVRLKRKQSLYKWMANNKEKVRIIVNKASKKYREKKRLLDVGM